MHGHVASTTISTCFDPVLQYHAYNALNVPASSHVFAILHSCTLRTPNSIITPSFRRSLSSRFLNLSRTSSAFSQVAFSAGSRRYLIKLSSSNFDPFFTQLLQYLNNQHFHYILKFRIHTEINVFC